MANTKFTVTCPHCNETFEVEKVKKARGQLAGIALEDMTDDQLKREIINAGSVLYKAKQRGAADEVIAANQARLDAAKAEKAKRNPMPEETVANEVAEALEGASVDEATANEI